MDRQEEKLIELVRSYKVLYNTSDSGYMKTKYKQEIWKKIASELDMEDTSGEEAKLTWKKLRNNHRDALRRRKRLTRSGAAATDIKPWKFEAQMEYLLQYMVNDNRGTNFPNDDNTEVEGLQGQNEGEATEDNLSEEFVDENEDHLQQNDASVEEDGLPLDTPTPAKKPKTLKKGEIDSLILKSLEQRERRANERDRERKLMEEKYTSRNDDLYLFFMSMYEQTKKMSPVSQHIIRRNVFMAVSQEEARLLNIQENEFPPPQPLPTIYSKF